MPVMLQTLACAFTYAERARGIITSGVLLGFWALLFLGGSASLWSQTRRLLHDVSPFSSAVSSWTFRCNFRFLWQGDRTGPSVEFLTSIFQFLLIAGELLLSCFADVQPNYSKVADVSGVSRILLLRNLNLLEGGNHPLKKNDADVLRISLPTMPKMEYKIRRLTGSSFRDSTLKAIHISKSTSLKPTLAKTKKENTSIQI